MKELVIIIKEHVLFSTVHYSTSCSRIGSFMRVAVSAALRYSDSSMQSSNRSSASVILSIYFSASLKGNLYLQKVLLSMQYRSILVNVTQELKRRKQQLMSIMLILVWMCQSDNTFTACFDYYRQETQKILAAVCCYELRFNTIAYIVLTFNCTG